MRCAPIEQDYFTVFTAQADPPDMVVLSGRESQTTEANALAGCQGCVQLLMQVVKMGLALELILASPSARCLLGGVDARGEVGDVVVDEGCCPIDEFLLLADVAGHRSPFCEPPGVNGG